MSEVLILGAGRVAGPVVRTMLGLPDANVTVASELAGQAATLVGDAPNGSAVGLRVEDQSALAALAARADVVISLVPPALHLGVAEVCIDERVPLVTTSYTSDALWALDERARQAGVLILMESGEDPGLDHMAAKEIVDDLLWRGGQVVSLRTFGAGLADKGPSLNPVGHRLAWSPIGLLQAATRDAVTIQNGRAALVRGGADLFANPGRINIPELGWLETYPNRDARGYARLYGIPAVPLLYRGLLRFPGWCSMMAALARLGLLDESPVNVGGRPWSKIVDHSVRQMLAPDVLERLDWLGLFGEAKIPAGCASRLEALASLMEDRLAFEPGERDLVIVHVEIEARVGSVTERHAATLIARGDPHPGETAMSRAVGWPAAEAARLILAGEVAQTGVRIPTDAEVYRPILAALARRGLCFERTQV